MCAVVNSGRKSLPMNVQTYWNNIIFKTYFKDKKRNDQEDLIISTVYEVTRYTSGVNTAFIKAELLCKNYEKHRYSKNITQ